MVKKINLQINLTDKWIYTLVTFAFIIALGVGVYAYQANMQAGNPPTLGHSAGEIHVNNSAGEIVSLQEALDDLGGNLFGELYVKEISLSDYASSKTADLGEREFCVLSKQEWVELHEYSSYFTKTVHRLCRVYEVDGNWYLEAILGSSYRRETISCAATCF